MHRYKLLWQNSYSLKSCYKDTVLDLSRFVASQLLVLRHLKLISINSNDNWKWYFTIKNVKPEESHNNKWVILNSLIDAKVLTDSFRF